MSQRLPLPLSAKARRTGDSPINELISAKMANPALINFAAGLVDDESLPVEHCQAIAKTILSDSARGKRALQYGTTIGLRPLRETLLKHLCQLENLAPAEMSLSADQILLSTGSQQALYLIADVLLDPGDIVITANPSYFVFTGALQSMGANVIAVPMDENGMQVEKIAGILDGLVEKGQLDRVKFIYCTSFFDNPTGLSLSLERRQKLLEIARKYSINHRIMILEDAAYRELRYDGESMRSIKSFDGENLYTIITQTFSKPFAPGIKLGYTAMPPDLLEQVLRQKGSHDFGSSNLCQEFALAAFELGVYEKHLNELKLNYRQKRDATLAALKANLKESESLFWTHPHGGLYVWLTLPETVNTARSSSLFAECVKRGVLYVPGVYSFHPQADGHVPNHHMRLCYGQVPMGDIVPGIERLTQAIRSQL